VAWQEPETFYVQHHNSVAFFLSANEPGLESPLNGKKPSAVITLPKKNNSTRLSFSHNTPMSHKDTLTHNSYSLDRSVITESEFNSVCSLLWHSSSENPAKFKSLRRFLASKFVWRLPKSLFRLQTQVDECYETTAETAVMCSCSRDPFRLVVAEVSSWTSRRHAKSPTMKATRRLNDTDFNS